MFLWLFPYLFSLKIFFYTINVQKMQDFIHTSNENGLNRALTVISNCMKNLAKHEILVQFTIKFSHSMAN